MNESFVDSMEIKGPCKNAETLFTAIVKKLCGDGLLLEKCVAQSYDNARVIPGDVRGVQTLIKRVASCAEHVNCSNHSLNLCCLEVSKVDAQMISMFRIVEQIYTFFSSSRIVEPSSLRR